MKSKTLSSFLIVLSLFSFNAFAKDTAPVIENGKKVSLNYTLKVDGKIVDTSEGKAPLAFTYGGTMHLIPGFTKALAGLKAGDKKAFTLTPNEAYGPMDPKALVEVPKTSFPAQPEIQPGMVFTTHTPTGEDLHGTVKELKGDKVLLDFNHPLAGKTLNFEITVLSVE